MIADLRPGTDAWSIRSVDDVRSLCREALGRDPGPEGVEFLSGGVSSTVALVRIGDEALVVKQALPALKVASHWQSRVERALVEARAAETLGRLVPGSVPRLRTVVPARHAFLMDAAPAGSEPWRDLLMRGDARRADAARVGLLLARIHAASAADPSLGRDYADRSFFDELRVDPYLRRVAEVHADVASAISRLIDELAAPGTCLVHGDYSPKNLLVTPDRGLLLIDHEVAHWGAPAFDVAFVLTHLCLKAVHRKPEATRYLELAATLLDAYRTTGGIPAGASGRLAGGLLGAILLARVDGKSPVGYLSEDDRRLVRDVARGVLRDGPRGPDVVLDWVASAVARAVAHG